MKKLVTWLGKHEILAAFLFLFLFGGILLSLVFINIYFQIPKIG